MEERFAKFQRETNQRARDEIAQEVARIRTGEISQVHIFLFILIAITATIIYIWIV